MSDWWRNDDAVDLHYSRDYYGPDTDYFEPPEEDWVEDDIEFEEEEE